MNSLLVGLVSFLTTTMELLAALFILLVGFGVLWLIVIYIIDVSQTQQTIRRNYPIIGRFRYFFEHVGEFFRQYFFAMDREELPFNRAQRSWVYRASKNVDSTVTFGSTDNINGRGMLLFVNCAFPTLWQDAVPPTPVTIGADCLEPYTTDSLINILGMSYGAISKPAVLGLSAGAKAAGWLDEYRRGRLISLSS